jgi:SpoVK/Ycf46/Vps4 family AAA+-type ATPase
VHDSVVNQLLSKIDGLKRQNNLLVIGVTNKKELLDSAMLRPGRLEVHLEVTASLLHLRLRLRLRHLTPSLSNSRCIHPANSAGMNALCTVLPHAPPFDDPLRFVKVGLPDAPAREQILRIHVRRLAEGGLLAGDVQLEALAQATRNYSGAELEALATAAASHALERTVQAAAAAAGGHWVGWGGGGGDKVGDGTNGRAVGGNAGAGGKGAAGGRASGKGGGTGGGVRGRGRGSTAGGSKASTAAAADYCQESLQQVTAADFERARAEVKPSFGCAG